MAGTGTLRSCACARGELTVPLSDHDRRVADLLRKAMERQRHGADDALMDLLRGQTVDGDAEAAYDRPHAVRWRDADDAERALLRFLQDYPA